MQGLSPKFERLSSPNSLRIFVFLQTSATKATKTNTGLFHSPLKACSATSTARSIKCIGRALQLAIRLWSSVFIYEYIRGIVDELYSLTITVAPTVSVERFKLNHRSTQVICSPKWGARQIDRQRDRIDNRLLPFKSISPVRSEFWGEIRIPILFGFGNQTLVYCKLYIISLTTGFIMSFVISW